MHTSDIAAPRYDRRTIALHWASAALIGCLWVLGETIDLFPKGEPRIAARSLHIVLGVGLALVLIARLAWRAGGRAARLPPAGAGRLDALASLTHKALYGLVIMAVVLGIANAWVRGDTVFGLFRIPAFDPGNKDLRESVEDWHGLAANVLLFAALLHAAAALAHHFVRRDGVLRRMLPLRSRR